uniref:BZIP domain-containing protein n=1 Tax=Amphora coffeiformis TaxID=265554 RepID=A0A7S3L6B5_9STRA|mmetsp:Transcript_1735/g.3790  ORF Transcript_1735/g.3790 Transcript_1735/m.3790 type:complete len:444 (-) Transcript_1735:64-1395(-)
MEGSYWNGEEGKRLMLEAEVEQAIHQLDRKERRAYETALEVFPALVRRETKIMDFLRIEGFHVKNAATRLAAYWRYRKQIFEERWLLPMTQTGKGALTMREVEMIRSGYIMPFSRPTGLVVLYDMSRIKNFDSMLHVKNMIYTCTVFTDEVTQVYGATVIYVVRSGDRPLDTTPEGWDIFRVALPMKIRQMLVAQAFEEGKEGILNFLAYQTKRTVEFRSRHQAERLIADSLRGTRVLLENKGIERQYLPRCLGGDFSYDRFSDWVRMRISLEDIMSPAPLKCNKLNPIVMIGGSALSLDDSSRSSSTACGAASSAMIVTSNKKRPPVTKQWATKKKKKRNASENDEGAKKLNALYARRAYHKRKLEMLGLEEQTEALRKHNKKLQAEKQQLESYLRMAQQTIAAHGIADSPACFFRGAPPPPQEPPFPTTNNFLVRNGNHGQ